MPRAGPRVGLAMSEVVETALAGVLVFATAVWIGGYVAIVVVAWAARRALRSAQRVTFFRELGRAYGVVGGCALVLALGTGASLVYGRPWGGVLTAAVVVAAVLVASVVAGVAQAKGMTRLRRRALRDPDDMLLDGRVRRGARRAGVLRAMIGALSLALLALGVLMAA